ncbi:PREDICTED: mis18-binding protein 1-like isoform X2 [Amphimedon queenslandica]|uniref:Myb-like domain-containing protein n=1 Tax=Amphimedon queenslandica TaxID=400682 RepID=A0AAN0JDQ3_AMPQE|nr:PREDICTED: mis18-binding protein 1-like isoform X2 [Amphimedon queenslandica]|eukprot:XP_019855155.1 PREDICTED: mis18-binding protein 1-like isoform X2 [Amphimedon queenslandica]
MAGKRKGSQKGKRDSDNLKFWNVFPSPLRRSSRGRIIKPRLKNLASYYDLTPDCIYKCDYNSSTSAIINHRVPVLKLERVKEIKRISSKDGNKLNGASLINDNKPQLPCTSKNSQSLSLKTDNGATRKDSLTTDRPTRRNSPSKRPAKMRRSSLKAPKLTDSLSKSTPNSRKVHFEVKEDDTINESNVWNESDIRRLRETVYNVPAIVTEFWEEVGRKMKRPPEHCQSQYLMSVGGGPTTLAEVKMPSLDRTDEVITARVGTLKRKLQLRMLLSGTESGYADDAFNSSPLRNKLKAVERETCLQDSERHSCSKEEDDVPPSSVYKSPVLYKKRFQSSPSSSPHHIIPDILSIKRDTADQLVYRYEKAKKEVRPPPPPVKPVHATANAIKPISQASISRQLKAIYKKLGPPNEEQEEEEEEEEDGELDESLSDLEEDFQIMMSGLRK